MAIVMSALFLTVCKMFAKQENCQNVDLENEGQGQGVEKHCLSHSTRNVRIHIGDFFKKMLATWEHVYAKRHTHRHTHTHTHTPRNTPAE